jgi:bifunctional non-homologous end joining protein LigD
MIGEDSQLGPLRTLGLNQAIQAGARPWPRCSGSAARPRPSSPCHDPDAKDSKWAEPQLVCEVEFTTWTCDGRAKQPAFKGLREDKPARSVRREAAK